MKLGRLRSDDMPTTTLGSSIEGYSGRTDHIQFLLPLKLFFQCQGIKDIKDLGLGNWALVRALVWVNKDSAFEKREMQKNERFPV